MNQIWHCDWQGEAIFPARDTGFIMFWCFIWSRWLDIGLFIFVFMDLNFVSVHIHAKIELGHPKKELGQYPAILTSCLVNNPYILLT